MTVILLILVAAAVACVIAYKIGRKNKAAEVGQAIVTAGTEAGKAASAAVTEVEAVAKDVETKVEKKE